MLTTNLAIVAPVTEADDRAARETVWQQVTERILPQMGKLCTRFEPSVGAWGRKYPVHTASSWAETNRRCSCTSTHPRSISWMNAQRRILTALWSIWNLETSRRSTTQRCARPTSRVTPPKRVPTWNGTSPACSES